MSWQGGINLKSDKQACSLIRDWRVFWKKEKKICPGQLFSLWQKTIFFLLNDIIEKKILFRDNNH